MKKYITPMARVVQTHLRTTVLSGSSSDLWNQNNTAVIVGEEGDDEGYFR